VNHISASSAAAALSLWLLVQSQLSFCVDLTEMWGRAVLSTVVVSAMDPDGQSGKQGRGVVVAQDRVITNCHVTAAGTRVHVELNGHERMAQVIERNSSKDLCLLSVQTKDAPAARLRRSTELAVGDEVYAIGGALGLNKSVSKGIISGPARHVDGEPCIQFTAPVSPGASGGGLFDGAGLLVGITTGALVGAHGIYLAAPVDWVDDVLLGKH
jgi:serine protease Do